MDVSVIIVNYNTRQLTDDAIESIYKHTSGIDFEIILVDNASTDGSKAFFEKKDNIRYIYSEQNLGFGQGNNLGLEYATGRNIFFLNSDTLLRNNAIKILSDYLDTHPDVGVCGGNLFGFDGKPTISYEIKRPSVIRELNAATNGRLYKIFYKDAYFNSSRKAKEVGYVSGADFMTRKSILDKYGAFSPEFFMYYEETELTHRINEAGYRIISLPNAEIVHLAGMSGKNNNSLFNEQKYTWMTESFWKYLKLCCSPQAVFFIRVIHKFASRLKIYKYSLTGEKEWAGIERRKSTLFEETYSRIFKGDSPHK